MTCSAVKKETYKNTDFSCDCKVINISARRENRIISDLLDIPVSGVKIIKKMHKKDINMSLKRRQFSNPIQENKSDMLISIENKIMTWLDFYNDVSRLAEADKLYSLPGIPESNDFEKEEITKMRTFLYYFYNHGFWNISSTCEYIGVSLVDVQNWSKRYHSFKESIKLMMSARDDFAESQLLKQMDGTGMPSVTATIFYLRTMGRARGWGEETTVNVNGSRSDMTKEQVDKIAESYKTRIASNMYKNRNQAILAGSSAHNSDAHGNSDMSGNSVDNVKISSTDTVKISSTDTVKISSTDTVKDIVDDILNGEGTQDNIYCDVDKNPFKASKVINDDDDVFEIY